MPAQYIFTIENLSKAYGKKDVLKNIWLSFYPGAKIGVIGGNGSGKSTLLRIMAGIETDFIGTARPAAGITIGYLPQEPTLDPTLDVRGNVEMAVAPIRALLARFDEINARLGEGPDADEMDALLEEQAKVQDAIEAAEGWDLDRRIEIAMDAMRLPPGRRRRRARSPAANAGASPSARSCSNGPTCCCSTSRPTTSTPRASPGSNGTCRNIRAPSCSSPTTATSSTTSPSGSSSSTAARASPGRATTRPGSSRSRRGWPSRRSRKARRRKQLARELEWVRMSPRARVAKNRARLQRYEQLASQDADRRDEADRAPDPARARTWATSSSRPRTSPRATATTSCSRT